MNIERYTIAGPEDDVREPELNEEVLLIEEEEAEEEPIYHFDEESK